MSAKMAKSWMPAFAGMTVEDGTGGGALGMAECASLFRPTIPEGDSRFRGNDGCVRGACGT